MHTINHCRLIKEN